MQSQPSTVSDDDNTEHDSDQLEPSKSQRKREADKVRDFARLLTTLPKTRLKSLSLPEEIMEAIRSCPPASTRGAHKRHLMFISKLMRKTERVDEWRAQLESPALKSKDDSHEIMRDKLVQAFAEHVDELREHYPTANLQQVRQLIRQINAGVEVPENISEERKKEIESINAKAAKAQKALLQVLSENAGPT